MSVERIVAAAIDIIDRDGLDGLGMRTLATELDTGTATLYRYVHSKEEVLVEAVDTVLGEIRLAPEFSKATGWRTQIRMTADALRVGLLAHPNITPLLATSVPIGPAALRAREANLDLLIAAGFEPAIAAQTYVTIVHYTIGFVLAENPHSSAYGTDQKRSLKRYYQGLPTDRFPHIVALADQLTARDNDQEFAFGLDLILDGVEGRRRRRRRTPERTRDGSPNPRQASASRFPPSNL